MPTPCVIIVFYPLGVPAIISLPPYRIRLTEMPSALIRADSEAIAILPKPVDQQMLFCLL